MKYFLCYFLFFISTLASGQLSNNRSSSVQISTNKKLNIDSTSYRTWPCAGSDAGLTNDGKYLFYTVENKPFGHNTFVVKSSSATWEREAVDLSGLYFSNNSRYGILHYKNNLVQIVALGGSSITELKNIAEVKLSGNKNEEWLACLSIFEGSTKLELVSLNNLRKKSLTDIVDFNFSKDGRKLMLTRVISKNGVIFYSRELIRLSDWNSHQVFESSDTSISISRMVADRDGGQVSFLISDNRDQHPCRKIFYRDFAKPAEKYFELDKLLTNHAFDITDVEPGFSKDGRFLFFTINKAVDQIIKQGLVKIWSYTDQVLAPEQELKEGRFQTILFAIDTKTNVLFEVESNGQRFEMEMNGNFILSDNRTNEGAGEIHWKPGTTYTYYLKSMVEDKLTTIDSFDTWAQLSPKGRYVIYYDALADRFKSYNIATRSIIDFAKNLNIIWKSPYREDLPLSDHNIRGIAGWFENDEFVLLYDRLDIWKIDLSGHIKPINLTNGFGKSKDVIFSVPQGLYKDKCFDNSSTLILSSFSFKTKANGFYLVNVSSSMNPKLLSEGAYLYEIAGNPYLPYDAHFSPIKALDAQMFLVRRMSATSSANYFLTNNFITFQKMSDINPELNYNWLTSELHSWTNVDGSKSEGILYKPTNFDSTRKYPVIFNYYEKKTDGLNLFIKPDYVSNGCDLNVPTFVDHGYLVFQPDLVFKLGQPGQSALETIESAAWYVKKLGYVDSLKIGLQGCSFAGFITNFVVAHSSLFSAACSASSISDMISHYGSVSKGGRSLNEVYEQGQNRIGASLWDRPDLFLRNSPILKLNEVVAPILIMHTTDDGICPFNQAIELFTGLRRLSKKAWLLEYKNHDHGLWGEAAADFNCRMIDFFDYFLMKTSRPDWMTIKE